MSPSTETPSESGPASGQSQRRFGPLTVLVLWPVVVLGLGHVVVYRTLEARLLERLDRELAVRPPLAVIDPADFVDVAGGDAKAVEAGLRTAIEAAGKLGAAGYVVVDRQAVLAAPAESRVPPP